MTKRAIYILTFLFLLFTLTAAESLSPDYAIVDDNPTLVRGYYSTIAGAVNSGATTIEVRAGQYPESVTIDRPLTLACNEGATLINDGTGVSITILAPDVTIQDCTIQGEFDGTYGAMGDMGHGVGVAVQGDNARIDGLITRNLSSFSVLNADATADGTVVENFDIQNVATVASEHKCASTAILFIAANEGHIIRNGKVSGYSGAIHLWYGVQNTTVSDNRLINNYGWIWSGFDRYALDSNKDGRVVAEEWATAQHKGGGDCNGARSAFEEFGLGRGNKNNRFTGNTVDGSNGWGIEYADVLFNSVASGNTVSNVGAGFWVAGSAGNYGEDIVIESNTFYGSLDGEDGTNWFSGSGVVRDNHFIDYHQENIGTIFVPADANGCIEVTGNHFTRNSRVMRISKGCGSFVGNTIEDSIYHNFLYFDSGVSGFLIADNKMHGANMNRAINAAEGVTGLTVRDNVIDGQVWAGAGSLVEGNEIRGDGWTAIMAQPNSIVRNNKAYADASPILFNSESVNTYVYDNYGATLANTQAPLPICTGSNVCRDNWTAP